MLVAMDASEAIADLTEISPQVKDVVATGSDGAILGSNTTDAESLLGGARRLLDVAETLRPGVAQLEAATTTGSVFVVRDGERLIAATTTPEPTVGLVFYDLKTCLRSIDDVGSTDSSEAPAAKPKRKRAAKSKEAEDAAS